ncbi:MAG: hypothetical protein IT577_19285 [Verrucomicrobiae bacterium]|nr:hypothetical protein [Verrucomicrobiae bacterium]
MRYERDAVKAVRGLLLAGGLALLGGCASMEAGDSGGFDKIVEGDVPMYENGPYQGGPPTRTVSSGTRVKVLSQAGGSLYVEMVGGARGYIPMSAVREQGGL